MKRVNKYVDLPPAPSWMHLLNGCRMQSVPAVHEQNLHIQFSLLIFLVCECILHAPIHTQGHQKRSKEGTTVKGVNTPRLCSVHSPRPCIPFVFQANFVERQIMLGFAASPAVPQFHGGLGKVDYFWESKQRGLGLLFERQLNIRRLFALQTRVTKLSSFGGSTMTSSGGMKNCIDEELLFTCSACLHQTLLPY